MMLALLVAQSIVLGDALIELRTSQDPSVRVTVRGKQVWEGVPKSHHPWKLAGGDIDGNGHPDFAVGVFKSTHLYSGAHRTVFFYELREGKVVPKWKGSSLGRPLEDYVYAEVQGKPKLVALQRRWDDSLGLFVWTWNKFGFRLEGDFGRWQEATLGATRPDFVEIRTGKGSEWVKL